MDEYITLKPTAYESYMNDPMEYVDEGFIDEADELCNIFTEMYGCYIYEYDFYQEFYDDDFYQEGEILDQATGKGNNESKLKKILLFIPRLLMAIARGIRNKFKNKTVQAATDVVEDIVNDDLTVEVSQSSSGKPEVVSVTRKKDYKRTHRHNSETPTPGALSDNIGTPEAKAGKRSPSTNRFEAGGRELTRDELIGNSKPSRFTIDTMPLSAKERGIGPRGTEVPATQLVPRININRASLRVLTSYMDDLKHLMNGIVINNVKNVLNGAKSGNRFNTSDKVRELYEATFSLANEKAVGSLIDKSGSPIETDKLGKRLLEARDIYQKVSEQFARYANEMNRKATEYSNKLTNQLGSGNPSPKFIDQEQAVRMIIIPYLSQVSATIDRIGTYIGDALIAFARYFEDLLNTSIIPSGATPKMAATMKGLREAPINDLGRGDNVINLGTSKSSGNQSNNSNKNRSTEKRHKKQKPEKQSTGVFGKVKNLFKKESYEYDEYDDDIMPITEYEYDDYDMEFSPVTEYMI